MRVRLLRTVFLTLVSGTVFAQTEPFGLGDGSDGDLTVASSGTVINRAVGIRATLPDGGLSVGAVSGFNPGDLVMILACRTADGGVSAPNRPVNTDAWGHVGGWQLTRITAVDSPTSVVNLADAVTVDVGPDTAQLIRVPQLRSLTILDGGSLTAPPWNGTWGGVVAVVVAGDVRMEGPIDVSMRGYAGGPNAYNSVGNTTFGGEGLFGALPGGSLPYGNAGGGASGASSTANGSSGGGANAGYGGNGGIVGGRGGTGGNPLVSTATAPLFFGGGGGGAFGAVSAHSAAGGGVVLLRARSATRLYVSANGGKGGDVEGGVIAVAGGGGAGGTIDVALVETPSSVSLSARGAPGGNAKNTGSAPFVSPGGGGSGGRVTLRAPMADTFGGSIDVSAGLGGTATPTNSAPAAEPMSPTEPRSLGLVSFGPAPVLPDAGTAETPPGPPRFTSPPEGALLSTRTLEVQLDVVAGAVTRVFANGALAATLDAGTATVAIGTLESPVEGTVLLQADQLVGGALSSRSLTRMVFVDATPPPPPVLLRPVEGAVVLSQVPTFDATVTQTDLAELWLDDALLATFTARDGNRLVHALEMPLSSGLHSWKVRALDSAGNASETAATFEVRPPARVGCQAGGDLFPAGAMAVGLLLRARRRR